MVSLSLLEKYNKVWALLTISAFSRLRFFSFSSIRCSVCRRSSFFLDSLLFFSNMGFIWLSASRTRFNCTQVKHRVSVLWFYVAGSVKKCRAVMGGYIIYITSSLRSSASSAFRSSSFLMTEWSSAIFSWNLLRSRSSVSWGTWGTGEEEENKI